MLMRQVRAGDVEKLSVLFERHQRHFSISCREQWLIGRRRRIWPRKSSVKS
jgi:hypothetical protein